MAERAGAPQFAVGTRLTAVALGLMVALGTACGWLRSGGGAAARDLPAVRSASRSLLGTAENAVQEGRAADELAARLSSQADQLSSYGKRLSPEDQALAASLRTSRAALDEIRLAQLAADTALLAADAEAARVAQSVMREPGTPAFVADLEAATKDAVKSTGCDYVAAQLLPDERAQVASDRPTVIPSAATLRDAAAKRLGAKWSPPGVQRLVDWTGWGTGVVKAAQKMSEAPTGTFELSSGVRSRAFYYYVKICHALPR